MYLYTLINVPLLKVDLNKSKMMIMILLVMYDGDKFSDLKKKFENYFSSARDY